MKKTRNRFGAKFLARYCMNRKDIHIDPEDGATHPRKFDQSNQIRHKTEDKKINRIKNETFFKLKLN